MLARAIGGPLRKLPEETVRSTAAMIQSESGEQAERHFAALKRILDREEPDYRA